MSSGGHGGGKHSSMNSNSHSMQHACASLCDEIVILWRLAALNPGISPTERSLLQAQFKQWHIKALDKVMKNKCSTLQILSQVHLTTTGGWTVKFLADSNPLLKLVSLTGKIIRFLV